MTDGGRVLAWARVLRLSLFPSAMADPMVGVFLGGGVALSGVWPTVAIACAASLCVYHGAMALNDWADRKVDAERGRERPLVRGELQASAVLGVAVALLVLGPALAYYGGLGTAAVGAIGVAAVVAIFYDLFGRGPLLGPTLLGTARAANLLFGALAAGWDPSASWAPALAAGTYGLFVLGIGRLGRMEDGEDSAPLGARPSRILRLLGAWLFLAPVAIAVAARGAGEPMTGAIYAWAGVPFGIYLVGARARLLWLTAGTPDWSPAKVEAVMGIVLSCLVPFVVGSLLLAVPGPDAWIAAALLILAQRSGRRLMRFIPPS